MECRSRLRPKEVAWWAKGNGVMCERCFDKRTSYLSIAEIEARIGELATVRYYMWTDDEGVRRVRCTKGPKWEKVLKPMEVIEQVIPRQKIDRKRGRKHNKRVQRTPKPIGDEALIAMRYAEKARALAWRDGKR
jgi:hypothetical protein